LGDRLSLRLIGGEKPMRFRLIAVIVLLSFGQTIAAQDEKSSAQATINLGGKSVTISEPGTWKLKELFDRADMVALVYVLSGDTEAYDEAAIYKAKVIKAFKGVSDAEIIYYGPYVGTELGGEYVLFLIKVPNSITPKATTGYGVIQYARVFNEGYSSMRTSYECVFDGKDINQQCDYGVRVCTDYIILPKSVATFPPKTLETPFGCRLIRRAVLLPLLESFESKK
jgi:hypothetical protein